MSTSASAGQTPKVGETDDKETPLILAQPGPSEHVDELSEPGDGALVPVRGEVHDVNLRRTAKKKESWWRRRNAAWEKLCDRRVTDRRKWLGRLMNGLLTIGYGITAGIISMTSITEAANASEPAAPYGVAYGVAVATMAAVAGRGFASIFRTGWARLAAWVPVLLAVIPYSAIFLRIGDVPTTSFLLILAGYVGPIVQDVVEVTGRAVESQDRPALVADQTSQPLGEQTPQSQLPAPGGNLEPS
ncbi:hypothetical protein [Curtobacterium flaccumfaciens]|uniref:hypothetical protein n=1 Tax=Curtobacterium flaccumfaciens TaxID=2035 RepID=UPI001BDED349|nr:hypothetical protein [Curtobacterium flaccumfaciens]MBT1597276.1 hypothetical protein [Curtobacterium flaccumfaciens pv. flaccumfaciens]